MIYCYSKSLLLLQNSVKRLIIQSGDRNMSFMSLFKEINVIMKKFFSIGFEVWNLKITWLNCGKNENTCQLYEMYMNVNGPYYHYNQYISNVSINDKQIIQFVSILNSRSVFWFKIRKKSHSVKTNEILLLLYLINKCRLGPMKLSWLRCPLTPNIKVLSESCLLSF